MYGTKVEIVLPKAEPGIWTDLSFPKTVPAPVPDTKDQEKPNFQTKPSADDDSDVDLDDLVPVRGPVITETS